MTNHHESPETNIIEYHDRNYFEQKWIESRVSEIAETRILIGPNNLLVVVGFLECFIKETLGKVYG